MRARLYLYGFVLLVLSGCGATRWALESAGMDSPEDVEAAVRTGTEMAGAFLPGWAQPLLALIPPAAGKLSQKVFDDQGREEVESDETSEEV